MRVLVTGGAGFIGSHLAAACVAAGDEVRVLDDLSSGQLENLAAIAGSFEWIEGSVVDLERVARAAEGCEVIYHLAAIASVPRSIEDPLGTHAVNATGTLNVLEAARRGSTRRVVFASSASVYGDDPKLPTSEDESVRPKSPYAIQKLQGELYCSSYTQLCGVECISLRYFNVYGPRQDPSSMYAGVIPIFSVAAARESAPTIYGDGLQTRDFVYVADVVGACRAAAAAPVEAAGQVFNIGRGERTSLLELLAAIALVLERPLPEPSFAAPRPVDVRHSQAEIDRARRLLGWEPSVELEEGLVSTVAFYLRREE